MVDIFYIMFVQGYLVTQKWQIQIKCIIDLLTLPLFDNKINKEVVTKNLEIYNFNLIFFSFMIFSLRMKVQLLLVLILICESFRSYI